MRVRSPAGIAVVLAAGAASIASYAAVSVTVNSEPSTTPFPGFVVLLQPMSSAFTQDQVKLVAATVPGAPRDDPSLSYSAAVCGSRPFSGVLVIGGSARLSHMSGIPAPGAGAAGTSSRAENLPDLTLRDEGTGTAIDLGPVQAVSLAIASPGRCASAYTAQQPEPLFMGQAQIISGQAAAPVQRQWRLGWWTGPRISEDWPVIGNIPGTHAQDLGTFLALDGLQGAWVRPALQYDMVSAGSLQADASVDQAQPELASDTDLAWDSSQPIQPGAVVTDILSMNRWQNWLVWSGIFLGIGGSLLASLLYEWARPNPASAAAAADSAHPQPRERRTKSALRPVIVTFAAISPGTGRPVPQASCVRSDAAARILPAAAADMGHRQGFLDPVACVIDQLTGGAAEPRVNGLESPSLVRSFGLWFADHRCHLGGWFWPDWFCRQDFFSFV